MTKSRPFLGHGLEERIIVAVVDMSVVDASFDDIVVDVQSMKSLFWTVFSNSVSAKFMNLFDIFKISYSVIMFLSKAWENTSIGGVAFKFTFFS